MKLFICMFTALKGDTSFQAVHVISSKNIDTVQEEVDTIYKNAYAGKEFRNVTMNIHDISGVANSYMWDTSPVQSVNKTYNDK